MAANFTSGPIELFYSYSHRDEDLRNELDKHLSLLKRTGFISGWYDREITGGKNLDEEIDMHLNQGSVILLLISADFLNSDYCYEREMARALERHKEGSARVIPIILRACDWERAPFGRLKALPRDGKPITSWENRDEAFTDVVRGIRKVIEELSKTLPSTLVASASGEKITFGEVNALVGLGVDLSGSMAQNIQNDSGKHMSRLESFRQAIDRLVNNAQSSIKENQNRGIHTSVDVFAYGFGLRGIEVCDLLSLMRIGKDVISKDEIEDIKRQYLEEVRSRYSGYTGTGDLARRLGLGGIAREVEGILRANAEAEIGRRVMIKIKCKLEERLESAGDSTMPIEELAELWSGSRDVLKNAEELIYGDTPMREAFVKIQSRFERELAKRDEYTDAILFILSDGVPTDGDPSSIADNLKRSNVTVVSCFVTDQDIADPRRLFNQSIEGWTQGAKLMFDVASTLKEDSEVRKFLQRKGWIAPPESRFFLQLNHSVILEEFIRVVLRPLESNNTPSLPRGM